MLKKLVHSGLTLTLFTSMMGLSFAQPTVAQTNLDDLIRDLCQKSIEVKLAANENRRRVEVSFDSVERSLVSSAEQRIQGTARLRGRNDWQSFTYNCLVRPQEGLVTQANYTLGSDGLTSSTRLCQEELRDEVRRNNNGSVEFSDRLETYYVSNTEEGVRGTVTLQPSRGRSERNEFDCIVNLREGRVTKLTYRPENGDRPTASNARLIRLCQDNIRQQISRNQIDLGGIFGISIGTGRNIEFDSAETFSISDNQEGVRGDATLIEGSRERRVDYECSVNLQDGTIVNATVH